MNDLIHLSMNEVLSNDDNYQKEWVYLERAVVEALSEKDDPVLPVSKPTVWPVNNYYNLIYSDALIYPLSTQNWLNF